jgi:hypothetical protein
VRWLGSRVGPDRDKTAPVEPRERGRGRDEKFAWHLAGRLEVIIDRISVYKLIGVILAAVPIVLFLKAIMGQSRKRSQAVSDFKKHMDYVFWVIMLLVGCGVIYSLGKLLYEFAR